MAVASLPAHENIVEQYRAWQQGGHFNIQMELCEGGSLAQLLFEVCDLRFQCQIKDSPAAELTQCQCKQEPLCIEKAGLQAVAVMNLASSCFTDLADGSCQMSPRLNVTPCCCLQLEKASELLSEEEVWYVLSEMAQVTFFSEHHFSVHVFVLSPSSVFYLCIICLFGDQNACSLVLTYDLALPAGTPFSTCKWSLASRCEARQHIS